MFRIEFLFCTTLIFVSCKEKTGGGAGSVSSSVNNSATLVSTPGTLIYEHYSNSSDGSLALVYQGSYPANWANIQQVYLVEEIADTAVGTSTQLQTQTTTATDSFYYKYTPLTLSKDGVLSSASTLDIPLKHACFTFIGATKSLYIAPYGDFTFGEAVIMKDGEQASATGELCVDDQSRIAYVNDRSLTDVIDDSLARSNISTWLGTDFSQQQTQLALVGGILWRIESIFNGGGAKSFINTMRVNTLRDGTKDVTFSRAYQGSQIAKDIEYNLASVPGEANRNLFKLSPKGGFHRSMTFIRVPIPKGEDLGFIVRDDGHGQVQFFRDGDFVYVNVKKLYSDSNLIPLFKMKSKGRNLATEIQLQMLKAKIQIGHPPVTVGVGDIFAVNKNQVRRVYIEELKLNEFELGTINLQNVHVKIKELENLASPSNQANPFSFDAMPLSPYKEGVTAGNNPDQIFNILLALHSDDLSILVNKMSKDQFDKIFGALDTRQLEMLRALSSDPNIAGRIEKLLPAPLSVEEKSGLKGLNGSSGVQLGVEYKKLDTSKLKRLIPYLNRKNMDDLFKNLSASERLKLIEYMTPEQAAQILRDNLHNNFKDISSQLGALCQKMGMDSNEAASFGSLGGGQLMGLGGTLKSVVENGKYPAGSSTFFSPNVFERLRNTQP